MTLSFIKPIVLSSLSAILMFDYRRVYNSLISRRMAPFVFNMFLFLLSYVQLI